MGFLIFFIIAIIVAIIGHYTYEKKREKYDNFLQEHSIAIKAMFDINQRYTFEDVQNCNIMGVYDNENFYNNIAPEDYLIYDLVYTQAKVKKAIKIAQENKMKYDKYIFEINTMVIPGKYDVETAPNSKRLLEKERKIISYMVQKPITNFSLYVHLRLTNIVGDYQASKNATFYPEQIEELIKRINQRSGEYFLDKDIWNSICAVERGKVSNKLRFSIYERDGYRCRKCGRSTDDLEIDHILPISKGGKSIPDNLQTLCHSCNYQKSNTIEPGTVRHSATGYCELCGAPMKLRRGSNGSFYGCSNYPKCNYTRKHK